MQSIPTNIAVVRRHVAEAARSSGRNPEDVRLVAVSKSRGVTEISEAIDAGVTDFGENYLQEALPKIAAIDRADVTWHFIGAIQSNKTKDIATHFQWVHTVDRAKIAQRLSDQRPTGHGRLNVLIQVNLDAEPQKAGATAEEARDLADFLVTLPQLSVRGLMAVPKPREAHADQLAAFDRISALFGEIRPPGASQWDTLSIGMSGDFRAAIEAGSTLVRIGTAIFGEREGGERTNDRRAADERAAS